MKSGILICLLFAAISSCFPPASTEASHTDSLLVVPFASHVSYHTTGDQTQLTYRVEQSYPATDALAFITESLKRNHWKPLRFDLWNPTIPSSHVRGWGAFDDETLKPEQRVYQWMAEWENENHEVVCYVLQFRYAKKDAKEEASPELMRELHVMAKFIGAKSVAQIRTETKSR